MHKLIRLITAVLGGEGYLNFTGNEFGHPEWLDFPRPGNDWSYQMCRRQFNLEKKGCTRFEHLGRFDKDLMGCYNFLQWQQSREYVTREDEEQKLICFDRGRAFVAINWFWNGAKFVCPVRNPRKYKIILDSEDDIYSGSGSKMIGQIYETVWCENLEEWQKKLLCGFQHAIIVDLRERHGVLFVKIE